jgi:hypothetical protein
MDEETWITTASSIPDEKEKKEYQKVWGDFSGQDYLKGAIAGIMYASSQRWAIENRADQLLEEADRVAERIESEKGKPQFNLLQHVPQVVIDKVRAANQDLKKHKRELVKVVNKISTLNIDFPNQTQRQTQRKLLTQKKTNLTKIIPILQRYVEQIETTEAAKYSYQQAKDEVDRAEILAKALTSKLQTIDDQLTESSAGALNNETPSEAEELSQAQKETTRLLNHHRAAAKKAKDKLPDLKVKMNAEQRKLDQIGDIHLLEKMELIF